MQIAHKHFQKQATKLHVLQRNELRRENAVLIRNISCIFKTARMELDRKDQELHKLRQPPGPPPQTTLGREFS